MGHQLTSSTLDILRTGRQDVIRQFRQALRARLGADVASTIRAWRDLLSVGADIAAVRREYMRALDGFDREVYYFSPSQRPFRPTRGQRSTYLENYLKIAPDTPEADQARLELFLLSIETGNFTRARGLLTESLDREGEKAIEGIPEAFEDYLEKPETQPWLEAAMKGVFLVPAVRSRITALLDGAEPQMLIALAAVKTALVSGDVDLARKEADLASAIIASVEPADRSPRLKYLHARLLVMQAREAALRGLFGEAVTKLQRAAEDMTVDGTQDVEYLMEVRFQAELMADLLAQGRLDALRQRVTREFQLGDDLVAPNWSVSLLRKLVRTAVAEFDAASPESADRWLACYDAGIALGKLRLVDASHAALDEVANRPGVPVYLRRKALLELATLDELQEDPYNAARNWAQLASEEGLPDYVRAWLAYRIAKAHLRIRYRVPEALAALATIAERNTGNPLGLQAEELLRAAGINPPTDRKTK
jgi:hypothetical protein